MQTSLPTPPRLLGIAVLCAFAAVAGCASLPRDPVPVETIDAAVIAGMAGVRGWAGEYNETFHRDLMRSLREEDPGDFPPTSGDRHVYASLALSGGGADGAFGAGYLKGWSEAGTRPPFKLVTGISTGALIAPFAYLGSDYDDELAELFTTVSSKDIFRRRSVFKIFRSESVATTTPLAELIARSVDDDLIGRIAEAHANGRRLYVATTNLDAQRLVVWNMGAIASTGHPAAAGLFRQVLLASASIPVAFPPVYIEVEVDGQRHDEMHVDGGVIAEFFLFGGMIDLADAAREYSVKRGLGQRSAIYVIRNGKLSPEPEQMQRKLTDIAGRSVLTLIKSVATSDMFRVWWIADSNGIDFYYVGIPVEHESRATELFDPVEMGRLFELGRSMALGDNPWLDSLPWLDRVAPD